MPSYGVLCDYARLPKGTKFDKPIIRISDGHNGNVHIHIESPQDALGALIDPLSSDLLRIASFVYGADQEMSRGGDADVYGTSWERDVSVFIPVSDVPRWNTSKRALEDVLFFLTGDRWSFTFSTSALDDVKSLQLTLDPGFKLEQPDCVYLLSGGMDSLCAVADAVAQGRRPLLVGQTPSNPITSRHNRVVAALRERFKDRWSFPDITAVINRTDMSDPKETTQRSRGFLFASLGTVFALRLGLDEVNLADNGVVSLNLPLNRQIINTRASRSTHPRFIRLFNELLVSLFGKAPVVKNPLILKTRTEALELLKAAGAGDLVRETVSCVHTRLMKPGKDHCGYCSQCIDRRFAMVAAGLDQTEDFNRYDREVFAGEMPEEDARTMAVGYHTFIHELEALNDEALLQAYPELYKANQPGDLYQPLDIPHLLSMLRQHAKEAMGALESMNRRHTPAAVRGMLPTTCLLRLVNLGSPADPKQAPGANGATWHSLDYRRIRWNGGWEKLSLNQARVVEMLDQAGPPGLGQDYVLERLEIKSQNFAQVFRGCWALGTLVKNVSPGIFALQPPDTH